MPGRKGRDVMGLPDERLPKRHPVDVSSEWTIPDQQLQAQDLRRIAFDQLLSRLTSWGRLLIFFRNKPAAVLVDREAWDRLVTRLEFLETELESRLLAEQLADRSQALTDPSRQRSESDFWQAFERTLRK